MITLHTLADTSRYRKPTKRLGRGPGSKLGKTCGRGQKGMGARSGYRRRYGYEGGQFRLYMKVPIRGFNNANFRTEYLALNLDQIEKMYQEGETVSAATLMDKGFIANTKLPIKLLGKGTLTKQVAIEVDAISEGAREKLAQAKISFTIKS